MQRIGLNPSGKSSCAASSASAISFSPRRPSKRGQMVVCGAQGRPGHGHGSSPKQLSRLRCSQVFERCRCALVFFSWNPVRDTHSVFRIGFNLRLANVPARSCVLRGGFVWLGDDLLRAVYCETSGLFSHGRTRTHASCVLYCPPLSSSVIFCPLLLSLLY